MTNVNLQCFPLILSLLIGCSCLMVHQRSQRNKVIVVVWFWGRFMRMDPRFDWWFRLEAPKFRDTVWPLGNRTIVWSHSWRNQIWWDRNPIKPAFIRYLCAVLRNEVSTIPFCNYLFFGLLPLTEIQLVEWPLYRQV